MKSDRKSKSKKRVKSSATENGRVAGQLGGLYVRGAVKRPADEKAKGKTKAPEQR